jgi:Peptidase family M28
MECYKYIGFFILLLFSSSSFAGESHLRIVRELTDIGPRVFGSKDSIEAAGQIRNRYILLGIHRVTLQPIEGKEKGFNVVAVIPGLIQSKQIIIGSHHDSVPGSPGAYDDAGGTSVLVNVAASFRKKPPPFTLVLCSFDGEEKGLKGSINFVKNLTKEEKEKTLFMLNLEMMGWNSGTPNIQTLKYDLYGKGQRIEGFKGYGLLTPAPLTKLILDSKQSVRISLCHGDPYLSLLYQIGVRLLKINFGGDENSFLFSGIPAVMFTDSSFSKFYPQYHQPGDKPENLNEKRLSEMTRLILAIIYKAKAENFEERIDAKDQQEYLTIGPIFLSHNVMRIFYFFSLGTLIWHLIRKDGYQTLTIIVLVEVLLITNLFNHYATFAFVVFGTSIWMYLFLEWFNFRSKWRNAIIFFPQFAVAAFAFAAWQRHFVYGTYITSIDSIFLLAAILLSIIRVNKLKIAH